MIKFRFIAVWSVEGAVGPITRIIGMLLRFAALLWNLNRFCQIQFSYGLGPSYPLSTSTKQQ